MSQFLVIENKVRENELRHNENLVKTLTYKKELNWGVAVVNGICEFMYMHVSTVWLKHDKNNFLSNGLLGVRAPELFLPLFPKDQLDPVTCFL